MDRTPYNLSHLAHVAGHIGRIQTLTVIPVEAGSSLELNINGVTRLAANRKEIVSECQVDICAFLVPHRTVYGQSWIDFINGGPDEVSTFTGIPISAAYRNPEYLGLTTCDATLNRALLEGYNRIFYNYYAVPSFPYNNDTPAVANTNFEWYPTTEAGAENCRMYGRLAARLPHVLNGGNMVNASGLSGWEAQDLTDADKEVTVTAGVFSLTDLAQVQSRYKTESQAAWFAHFYQDVMREKWGSDLGPDVDPRNLRPVMLGRSTSMLSGREVDGTDDATLGTAQGKTIDRARFYMPRKFFGEHGNVYVLALLRYPLVHTREQHPLIVNVNPSYDEIAGDPERIANLAPITYDPSRWLSGGSAYTPNAAVKEPYGQHYRFHPNRVHSNFATIPGYPFSNYNGSDLRPWYYYMDQEYKPTFQTQQIGQWQMQAEIICQKQSPVPGVASSIFAGT